LCFIQFKKEIAFRQWNKFSKNNAVDPNFGLFLTGNPQKTLIFGTPDKERMRKEKGRR
jgi:hypothetical protein